MLPENYVDEKIRLDDGPTELRACEVCPFKERLCFNCPDFPEPVYENPWDVE